MEIEGFRIKCYGWTELALLYNPEIRPETAARRLSSWVRGNEKLMCELTALGWRKGCRLLTPLQVKAMVNYLGEP